MNNNALQTPPPPQDGSEGAAAMSETGNMRQMLPEGARLQGGKYVVNRRIANGGFGNTYEVTNVELEERMALKEFFMRGVNERNADKTTVSVSNQDNRSQFDSQREKFRKEARRLFKMRNSHIVRVHDLFEENGTVYYTMDYIDGESLSTRIKRTGTPLTEDEVMDITNQVLDALEAVHEKGIFHLDLKPANIMLDQSGTAWLIDFGASKQMSASDGYSTTTAMCYTMGYAPTEQMDHKMDQVGPWTDLYALGATIYNLLTTHTPPLVSDLLQQQADAFNFPPTVSQRTRYMVNWMMQPRRQDRPQSVAQLKQFLATPFTPPATQQSEETIYSPPKPTPKATTQAKPAKATTPPPHTKPALSTATKAGIGVAAFVVVAAIVWLFVPKGNNDIDTLQGMVLPDSTAQTTVTQVTSLYFESGMGVCSYTGPVDSINKPHGKGHAQFQDGRTYDGPFVHGVAQGDSATFTFKNGDTFQGSFQADKFKEGRCTFADDGSYFEGTFKDGQPHVGNWYNSQGQIQN